MKHPSMWLAVLVLGAVPFAATAASFDYGPSPALLAANSGASQLPGEQVRGNSMGAMSKPDVMAGTGDDAAAEAGPGMMPHAAPPAPSPSAGVLPRNQGPIASSKYHGGATQSIKPTLVPNPASWRSLLPGSIQ